MTPLVELYEPANLPRVLAAGAGWWASTTATSAAFTPSWSTRSVARADSPGSPGGGRKRHSHPRRRARLEAAGVAAMLVGETLVTRPDIGARGG